MQTDLVARAPAAAAAMGARLDAGLGLLDVRLAPAGRDKLLAYLALLTRWNAVYNLTSVRDPLDMIAVHLLDAMSILPSVLALGPRRIVDVGTGAGLPGVPLAIALPDVHVELVDAVAKKVSFLRQVASALPLSNIHPTHARIEALTLTEKPDLIVSRAFSDLSKITSSVDGLVDGSTNVLAMKGFVPHAEIAQIVAPWRVIEVRPLDVPLLGAERCAVLLRRDA